MKKILNTTAILSLLALVLLTACNEDQSYADRLNDDISRQSDTIESDLRGINSSFNGILNSSIDYYDRIADSLQGSDIYIGHLRCLIKSGAGKEETERIYREALKISGIRKNPEFIKVENELENMLEKEDET